MSNAARFEVFANGILIGYSELEAGDPAMGVAGGRLIPLTAYSSIQPSVVAAKDSSQEHLGLVVRFNGNELPAQGGVRLSDYSAELADDGLQVEVLGIGYPLYEELFPAQVAAYKAQFSKM